MAGSVLVVVAATLTSALVGRIAPAAATEANAVVAAYENTRREIKSDRLAYIVVLPHA